MIAGGSPDRVVLPIGLPWVGSHFRLDALSAFFLAVVNLGAAAASLYALGYGRHEPEPQRVLPFFPAFLAGINSSSWPRTPSPSSSSWELMSLASWALVMRISRGGERAGRLRLYPDGELRTFVLAARLRHAVGTGRRLCLRDHAWRALSGLAGLVLVLALIGAGSKAGLVPLHVWLPLAHPAAPSHVSALMSGVMTKVAVYAFVRIVFDLLGAPGWWWGAWCSWSAGVTAVHGRPLCADAA